MTPRFQHSVHRAAAALAAAALAVAVPSGQAAEAFAAPGAKARLSVDYVYESAGRRSESGGYDPYEWRVTRTASLVADLAAQPPTAMPTVQAIDAGQMAQLAKQGAPRYQAWRATAQKGTYRIDESVAISNTDPICTSRPRHRCTRSETRKGAGDIPQPADAGGKGRKSTAAGYSAAEVDAAAGTLTVMLPVPLAMLPYTETITSDEPDGTYDTPIARGSRTKQAFFRVSATGTGHLHDKPFTVPLKGGWRSQSGEHAVKLKGRYGDEGTLTVRWRFAAQ